MQRNDPNNNNNNNTSLENPNANTPKKVIDRNLTQIVFGKDILPIIYRHATPLTLYRGKEVCHLFKTVASAELDKRSTQPCRVLAFIENNTNQLTDADKALAKAIQEKEKFSYRALRTETECRDENSDAAEAEIIKKLKEPVAIQNNIPIYSIWQNCADDFTRSTFFKYLHNNYFILCHEFFAIPMVKDYFKEISDQLTYHAMFIYKGHFKGRRISSTLNLETLLIACLLAEVVEKTEGQKGLQDLLWKLEFLGPSNKHIKNTAELYEVCRIFVKAEYEKIDHRLITQFYNCYINHLRKNLDQLTLKEIGVLVKEKLQLLDELSNQNQVRLNRN